MGKSGKLDVSLDHARSILGEKIALRDRECREHVTAGSARGDDQPDLHFAFGEQLAGLAVEIARASANQVVLIP